MPKEIPQSHDIQPKDSIYNNPLFLVQVTHRDDPYYQPKSPFPVEITDRQVEEFLKQIKIDDSKMRPQIVNPQRQYTAEELTDWLNNEYVPEHIRMMQRETLDKM